MAHDVHAHASHETADDQYLNTTEGSGHEHSDANVWMIIQFAIWLFLSAVVVHLLMWLMCPVSTSTSRVPMPDRRRSTSRSIS